MTKPFTVYNPHDIVIIPFPYTDNIRQSKRRPAVVLSCKTGFNLPTGHLICAMVTSGKTFTWPQDVPISDLQSAGLVKPCVIRMKLFTIDARLVLCCAGTLGKQDRKIFIRSLKATLPIV